MPARLATRPAPTVLVVDDDPDLRTVLRLLLEDEGYRVCLASDGQQALAHLRCERPAVLLLDLNMPVMTGWECLAVLRTEQRTVPVVLMTAGRQAEQEARRLGAAGWLEKPFDLNAVVQTVQTLAPAG